MTKLKELRRKAGLTQDRLAELTDISVNTIRAYEHRDRNPEGMALSTAIKLAEALGCDAKDLI